MTFNMKNVIRQMTTRYRGLFWVAVGIILYVLRFSLFHFYFTVITFQVALDILLELEIKFPLILRLRALNFKA